MACILLFCGCAKQDAAASRDLAAQLAQAKLALFAANNNAQLLDTVVTNWTWNILTADVEESVKKGGKPVAAELLFPDVRRDESNNLLLDGKTILPSPWEVRIEALVTTNMLPQVRDSRSNLASLWVAVKIDTVQRRPTANDNEEIVLRGRALAVESRPLEDWILRITPTSSK